MSDVITKNNLGLFFESKLLPWNVAKVFLKSKRIYGLILSLKIWSLFLMLILNLYSLHSIMAQFLFVSKIPFHILL